MRIIEQSHEILDRPAHLLGHIEKVARTCYQSVQEPGCTLPDTERCIISGPALLDCDIIECRYHSTNRFVRRLCNRGHHAMLEFGDITVRFTTNRGVSHELVRHRIGTSFAQESTRYVRYNNDMTFIKPAWWDKTKESSKKIWMSHAERTELMYQALLRDGQRPEQARDVLSHALATQVVVKANAREWRHIFALRCSKQAHPQMRALMTPLLEELQSIYPVIFEELT